MFNVDPSKGPRLKRIEDLRWFALDAESSDYMDELSEKICEFDQQLQVALSQRYGNGELRKMVPEWHKLVGSTPEDHDVNPEAKQFIVEEVERFVTEMETKWGLLH